MSSATGSSNAALLHALGVLALVMAMIVPVARGQPAESGKPEIRYWAYGGPTLTTLGAGVNVGLAAEFGGNVLSARATTTDADLEEATWEAALLYGRMMSRQDFQISGGVGVSVVGGMSYPHLFGAGQGSEFEPMIGFPVDGQVVWAPTRIVALGLHALASVNTAHPFGGVGVSIRLGNLR